MIIFNDIFWQNFLSTGNAGTKVKLDSGDTTLIIGKNGHGKSTLLDALCFALYGKPFRNVTKGQLVNSVNGKSAKVEVNFSTEGKAYRVVRGIKPNIFEIYIDGQLLSQDAATKDYQKSLEKQILKMNHKTFTQVIILGSSSFTPFMKLSAGARREVIEDILDIKIYSTMGNVNKEKVQETKTSLYECDQKISSLKTQVQAQRSLIDMLKKNKTDSQKEYTDKIDINNRRIEALEKDVKIIKTQIDAKTTSMLALNEPDVKLNQANNLLSQADITLGQIYHDLSFYDDHDECPSCKQEIAHDHKSDMISVLKGRQANAQTIKDASKAAQLNALQDMGILRGYRDEIQQLKIDSSSIEAEVRSLRWQIKDYEKSSKAVATDTNDLDKESTKLKSLASSITLLLEEKIELTEKRNLQEVATTLLKDSGIKTTVIREYLPLMNKLINKYLQAQDSFIQFEIDEQFEETIKSRHRDEFSYASFSEGERQRIDLSILFTWRQIARMKNSANTNLLILDEIMDGSLDTEGNDSAQSLIDSLSKDGTNVFVISHSVDQHMDKFARVLKFEKKNNFSVVSEVI